MSAMPLTVTLLPVPTFLSANKPLGPPRLWSSHRSSPATLPSRMWGRVSSVASRVPS